MAAEKTSLTVKNGILGVKIWQSVLQVDLGCEIMDEVKKGMPKHQSTKARHDHVVWKK